jgi:hypothetical protein
MTKREQLQELSELHCKIQHWEKGNEVVIERLTRYGYTLSDLIEARDVLRKKYNKRWGYLTKKKDLAVSE